MMEKTNKPSFLSMVPRSVSGAKNKIVTKPNSIPRTISVKPTIQLVERKQTQTIETIETTQTQANQIKNEDGIIIEASFQRMPENDEPVCCICGRYGEYICDQTDDDICSLECKSINISRKQPKLSNETSSSNTIIPPPPSTIPPPLTINQEQQKLDEELCFVTGETQFSTFLSTQQMSDSQIKQIRKEAQITVQGNKIVPPITSFSDCISSQILLTNLQNNNYNHPTPIQMQVIPIAMSGRDVLGCAQTGSGKTASFLIPLIVHCNTNLSRLRKSGLPMALILSPTRELCIQIEGQAKLFCVGLQLRTALIVGGLSIAPQIHRLTKGSEIIVATPGRLLDCMKKCHEIWNLETIRFFVLDEVDSMLHMGFEHQVMEIMNSLPTPRQTLLFSATIPKEIEKLSSKLLNDPVFVAIGDPGSASETVKQILVWVETQKKKAKLFELLQDQRHYKPPCVIFVSSCLGADFLSEAIQKTCNIKTDIIHGNKTQAERIEAINKFVKGDIEILISTNVLGRGVDLLHVNLVMYPNLFGCLC
eukprot:c21814_g2_i2.p1 GENE.c21814_g2_i2~~c21814_g2_i2.p1  ORF type:complete len:535 (+),score=209.73 c21814_g2_i2:8-1612(+)